MTGLQKFWVSQPLILLAMLVGIVALHMAEHYSVAKAIGNPTSATIYPVRNVYRVLRLCLSDNGLNRVEITRDDQKYRRQVVWEAFCLGPLQEGQEVRLVRVEQKTGPGDKTWFLLARPRP